MREEASRDAIPADRVGLLSGETAREYGPIVLIASATDTLPTTKVFEFDYQQEPILRELTSTLTARQPVDRDCGLRNHSTYSFATYLPCNFDHASKRNKSRVDAFCDRGGVLLGSAIPYPLCALTPL